VIEKLPPLPDQPGVYLLRDAAGKVLYVGKAKSLRKRVASHFNGTHPNLAHRELIDAVERVDFVVVADEAEALLTEEAFIKQYRPRFNVRLRDDKSYPYIAISYDEEFPRVYFTRERHRPGRLYFGPYASAKRVRSTLDVLQRVFYVRSCTGPQPGRRSGSPCLDYHIKRCQAPCVGYVTKEEYRRNIDAVARFLEGRYLDLERELEQRMRAFAEAQQYEQAASERNRLRAVRSLVDQKAPTVGIKEDLDVVAVALKDEDCNAQVLQVRDGRLSDRQSFYLRNEAKRPAEEVCEQFLLQYYSEPSRSIPPVVLVGEGVADREPLREALERKRGAPVRLHTPRRGEKRELLALALRNANLALEQELLREEHRRQQRAEAAEELAEELALERPPVRLECFDVSNLAGTGTVASMVVFEGGAAKRSDYRRFKIEGITPGDDYGALKQALERRFANYCAQQELSPYDSSYDPSFASRPDLVVIDGGRGQLHAVLGALGQWRSEGVGVVALAKREELLYLPDRARPLGLDRRAPALKLLQRLRDEAHRFAITHQRGRRTRGLSASLLDQVPGIGPARKKALLAHFGSPGAVLAASREELELVPGIPPKVARELHAHLHRTG